MKAHLFVSLGFALCFAACAAAAFSSGKVRSSAIAGSWYPQEISLVYAEVDQFLADASPAPALAGKPLALIVPHAGWRFSGVAAAAAFRLLKPGDFDRVVVVAPSHTASFPGFATTEAVSYRTPLGDVPVAAAEAAALREGGLVRTAAGAEDREHAIEIELPFLQRRLRTFRLLPILAGETSPEDERALAARLAKLADGRTLFVVSTDFTHYGPRYGYAPFGRSAVAARDRVRKQNDEAIGLLLRKDAAGFRAFLDRTDDTICGRSGLGVLLELLPLVAPGPEASLLARYSSIDVPGFEDENSVTYASIAFASARAEGRPLEAPPARETLPADAPPLDERLGKRLLALARATIETELRGTDALPRALDDLLPSRPELDRLQGVFVTLERTDPAEIAREGRLRGCIGQIFPALPLREAVIHAAMSAALRDTRFRPVEASELPRLEVEITALSLPRPVASWREIVLGTHGIVISKGGRKAVFLPQVPIEEGWTVEETLSHLSRKAGLPSDAWREGASFEVFRGQIFREAEESHGAAR